MKLKKVITVERSPIALLGVPFDNVTTAEALDLIQAMIESRSPHYLATANVDFVVQASEDVELRRILLDAHAVFCDGMPLVWASRFLGNPNGAAVAGPGRGAGLARVLSRRFRGKRGDGG
jgi:UDP-N-acetyl-D-mannosaminuronic acid transferase (WecB/TagA/CpsF family)